MAAKNHVRLAKAQLLATRHPQLFLHQIDAADHLAHRMLHLDAGIHLEEVKLFGAFVVDELDSARADIADASGKSGASLAEIVTQGGGEGRRRRLLDQLLVAALQRAVALADVNQVAMGIAEHLDLEMPGVDDVALDIQRGVTERGAGFAGGRLEHALHVGRLRDDLHALAAAAGSGFQQHRKTDPAGDRGRILPGRHLLRARQHRQAKGQRPLSRLELVAHVANVVRRGPDKHQALGSASLGKRRRLG